MPNWSTARFFHAGRIPPQRGWGMRAHRHSGHHELIVVIQGRLEARLADCTLRAGPGEVLWYPQGEIHAETAVGQALLQTVFLAWKQTLGPGDLPRLSRDRKGRIRTLVEWMTELPSHGPAAQNRLDTFVAAALETHAIAGQDAPADPRIERVRAFVSEHLTDRINIGKLAAIACLSPFHFAREFRLRTGSAPMAYVRQSRIDAAKNLLLTTDLPLRSIAHSVGFPDEFELSRTFRRLTGHPPSSLRRLT